MRTIATVVLALTLPVSAAAPAPSTKPSDSYDPAAVAAALDRLNQRQAAGQSSELERLKAENAELKKEVERLRAALGKQQAGAPAPAPAAAVPQAAAANLPALRFENAAAAIAITDIRYDLKGSVKQNNETLRKLKATAGGKGFDPPAPKPDDYQLFVTLKIRNKDARRVFTYRGQQIAGASIPPGTIQMQDDVGNQVSNVTYWLMEKIGNDFEQLKPSSETTDTQVFDLPLQGAKSLKLTIPASALTFNSENVIEKNIVFEVAPNQIRQAK